MASSNTSEIYHQVSKHYSAASKSTSAKYGEAVAKSFGYTEDELANIPEDANLGLSCGNPLAIASLREGETVVDLGSGAGFDIFLASSKVGASGKAIGVDMNDDMLARANKIKATKPNRDNVSFVKGVISAIPLESGTADCIISNCVINLVPESDKPIVFKEMHRLLKAGGRIAISDILAKQPLPQNMRDDIAMYVGCIAGASQLSEYKKYLSDAGFDEVLISDTKANLNVYLDTNQDGSTKKKGTGVAGDSCCAPAPAVPCEGTPSSCKPEDSKDSCCVTNSSDSAQAGAVAETDLNAFVGSYKIYAIKK
ncbi:S-adenosyl-L-methionine-dependent methyltransferase [Apodospora peruviana]|uniref:Arsenite methyltransferase n=1 Tax=Apodospora peruviana TaxID=516989 RepID=A0AAE0M2Y9_9PEZI|nr:S-adenosyl-L-methionine-dependent methyltransferase [Apodospora peruviana]